MTRSAFVLTLLLVAGAASARAQVHVQIELGLPVAPPLVVIQPGVQVVEGFDDEVFFHNGWYWCRRYDGWYRARSPRARFAWVEVRRVPRRLVEVPVGHYRNWHHDHGSRPLGRPDFDRREERREERRDDRREFRREAREAREERHEERAREKRNEREREREGRERRHNQ